MDRRKFLSTGVLAGGALAFHQLAARLQALHGQGHADLVAAPGRGAYGPLSPARAKNTGELILELPRSFEYTVFGRTGDRMSDGNPTPPAHDGMAAFAGADGSIRLVRNHEVANRTPDPRVLMGRAEGAYDPGGGGGTTTLVVDGKSRLLRRDFVSLGGTLVNCAGGPTPWGSWITCEETVWGPAEVQSRGRAAGGFARAHGYCFEVPAAQNGPARPLPLRAMGRFVHEAIAVDPGTGIVYQTEDQGRSGFYRFLPRRPGHLAAGGRLEMLAIAGRPEYDTRSRQEVGKPLPVRWVPIPDPDPQTGDAALPADALYGQGVAQGAATFARLEGCWYGNGRVYLNATSGGDRRLGQVWEYAPGEEEEDADGGGRLTLLFESPDAGLLESPDNICVSPRGGIVLCEDRSEVNFVRGLTPEGRIFDLARNAVSSGEFAGATFSPDGETLFLNIQRPGLTLAIWGPWAEGAL